MKHSLSGLKMINLEGCEEYIYIQDGGSNALLNMKNPVEIFQIFTAQIS
jgi:hypothetical protein